MSWIDEHEPVAALRQATLEVVFVALGLLDALDLSSARASRLETETKLSAEQVDQLDGLGQIMSARAAMLQALIADLAAGTGL
jgi:hypothetical protein